MSALFSLLCFERFFLFCFLILGIYCSFESTKNDSGPDRFSSDDVLHSFRDGKAAKKAGG